ncbi:MAG: hypothetical protein IJE74_02800 [Clostridia bacterium]|nr:hypothetical protein [Clostridia bacterium]
MHAFFWKAIAFIISVILPLFNIPVDIDPIIVKNEDIEIVDSSHEMSYNSDGNQNIFFSYEEFMIYCNTINKSNGMEEYAKTIDKDFFDDNNLVIVDVTRSSSGEKVFLKSVTENGTKLSIAYSLVSDMGVDLCVICYDSICIKTSKLIYEVEITEESKETLPFINKKSGPFFNIVDAEKTNNPEEEIELTYLFKDYDSWQKFLAKNEWKFYGYADKINKNFFESNNLGLVFSPIGNSETETRICEFNPSSKEIEVTCYNVSQPSIGLTVIGFNAVFVNISKETESIKATYTDYSVPFMLDGTLPMR